MNPRVSQAKRNNFLASLVNVPTKKYFFCQNIRFLENMLDQVGIVPVNPLKNNYEIFSGLTGIGFLSWGLWDW